METTMIISITHSVLKAPWDYAINVPIDLCTYGTWHYKQTQVAHTLLAPNQLYIYYNNNA